MITGGNRTRDMDQICQKLVDTVLLNYVLTVLFSSNEKAKTQHWNLLLGHTHLNEHTRLVVRVSGEGLGLLGWDGGVMLDKSRHYTTSSLDTQRQRCDIEQEQILDLLGFVTVKDSGLDSWNRE